MKNTVLVLLTILLLSFQTPAQQISADSIDVRKAVRLTLEKHPAVVQASKQIDVAQARIMQQNSSLYPEVEADASYNRIGPVATFDLPGGLSAKLYPENNYDAHLSLKHTLYDFGKRNAASELAGTYETMARDNVALVKSNLAYQTIQVFYTILFLEQSMTVKDEQIRNLNSHLEFTKAKVASGSATDFDVLTTQVRVSAAQNQKIDLANEIQKQEILLRNLMGLPVNTPLNLKGNFNFSPVTLNSDSLLNVAIKQRNEIRLSHDAEISADKQKRSAQLSDMPSVNLNMTYGLKNGYIPNLDVLRGNWVAGLLFRYPIYNGDKTRYQVEEAEANYQSTLAHSSDVELSIRSEVNRAASDVISAQNQLETVRIQVERAAAAVQRAELQYRDGVITNLDLLDAQTGLTEAKLSELQIVFRNIINRYALQKAAGDIVW
ncbi:MAG: TolC family protein [Ignavibacteriales bacterium]